jgi:hypothetical protein
MTCVLSLWSHCHQCLTRPLAVPSLHAEQTHLAQCLSSTSNGIGSSTCSSSPRFDSAGGAASPGSIDTVSNAVGVVTLCGRGGFGDGGGDGRLRFEVDGEGEGEGIVRGRFVPFSLGVAFDVPATVRLGGIAGDLEGGVDSHRTGVDSHRTAVGGSHGFVVSTTSS